MRQKISLGDKARDTISGFEGIVVAITNWLNGCQRITIAPQKIHDGKVIDSHTFDAEQVAVVTPAAPLAVAPTGGPSIAPTRAADPR